MIMTETETDAVPRTVLEGVERETGALLEHMLRDFLDIDFQDHSVLGGVTTGGHVVTRLAREADRMADELLAATGRPVPPPDLGRQWDVETGGLRPGAVLIDDLHASADRLGDALAGVGDWSAQGESIRAIPGRRLLQLVVHHVDLGRPWDELPEEDAVAAARLLPVVLGEELAGIGIEVRPELAGLEASAADGGTTIVAGSPRALLAWATGRTEGFGDSTNAMPRPRPRTWI